jgi:TolB protein
MKRTRVLPVAVAACAALLVSIILADARPTRYGHSDREERHLFPAVSTGPLDPAWSPDGQWIAFSMRGDIWKVPARGGEAIALTAGPNYHFEPAWSPDGSQIALSLDVEGNLEIGLVSAEGGPVRIVAPHPRVDLQPAWSPDGKSLYFVSARAQPRGGAVDRIYRYDLDGGADTAVSVVRGIQPSVSPDGGRLAYVDGGLRILDLTRGESRLVRAEETAYRMRPRWTPDGQSLLYVTDERGSNDVRIVAASGGWPVELTVDDEHHELSPDPGPDGNRFAFVSNHDGPTTLYTAPMAGGRRSAWTEVPITARRPVRPEGRVRLRILGPDGTTMPARVYLDASDGRSYSPEGGFHRAMMVFDRHYFHTPGEDVVVVPAGTTRLEALRGFEYRPAAATVDVPAGGEVAVTIRLDRMADMPALGWYSGDTHLHDLHQGRWGQTHESFFLQLLAEDVRVGHSLIHMDGTRIQGRWEDLTGQPHPVSTATHILQYGQEFRGALGHIALIGTGEFVLPFTAGAGGTPYAQHSLDLPYFDGAHRQGGIAGYTHPYATWPRTPQAATGTQAALNVALGRGDFYDVAALWSDELASADFYYRLLNAGFRITATGGTDNFPDVWRDPPSGSGRTYVRIDGPFSAHSWMEGVRAGRTFVTTGPLLLLDVEGHAPGHEITLSETNSPSLRVRVECLSITSVDSLQILVNGRVVETVHARDPLHLLHEGTVELPRGGWVAARALGPPTPYIGDDYAFAQTGPVYVVRGGKRFISGEDVRFLHDTVDALWARVENSSWRSEAERELFFAAVQEAREVYRRLAAEATGL